MAREKLSWKTIKQILRNYFMHHTNPLRIRAWFDFKAIAAYERLWRWAFGVKEDE